jgi:hypothetical protein
MMMQQGDQSPVATNVLRSLRNVTLLERPAPTLSVVSAVQAAVRGRERQYQTRDQIESIRKGEVRSRELQQQLEIAIDASELGTFHCDMPTDGPAQVRLAKWSPLPITAHNGDYPWMARDNGTANHSLATRCCDYYNAALRRVIERTLQFTFTFGR